MLYLQRGIGHMTVDELITMINIETNDLLDEREEYVPYINAAIDYVSNALIASRDYECIKQETVYDNMAVPVDFVAFVPKSGYPVTIERDTFRTYDGGELDVNYAYRKNHVKELTEQFPFSDAYISVVVFIVSFMVKKKTYIPTEYTSVDKAFNDEVVKLIAGARGNA